MKKIIIIILIGSIILSGAGITYLNNVVLPKTVKGLILKSIEEQTRKRATLDSLKINIFKGLVLSGLNIYDGDKVIVSVGEASCVFLARGLLRKKIIIPAINFNSAKIFLERRKDNTFNLAELSPAARSGPQETAGPGQLPAEAGRKPESAPGFSVEIYRINIINSAASFKDSSFGKPFSQDLNDINATVYLSLPNSLKFNGSAQIPGSPESNVALSGEFKFPQEELNADIFIKGLSLNRFAAYGQARGIKIEEGAADARISLGLKNNAADGFKLGGYLNLINAALRLDKINASVYDINGRVEFTQERLKAEEINLKYLGVPYKLSVAADNFASPDIALKITSEGLLIESNLAVDKTRIGITKLAARYFNSDFNAAGNFDALSSAADIAGVLTLDLKDLNKPLAKFKEQMDKLAPQGIVQAKFNLSGEIKDIKNCRIEIQASSPRVSLYGLSGENAGFYYLQQDGNVDIPFLNFSFYGGTVKALAKADLKSGNLPYSAGLSLQDIKIEELKLDTQAKNEDISGILQGGLKLEGFCHDFSKSSGAGTLAITKGKLWELNIFKGLGKLLFSKDFANMVFHEGSCSFFIKDRHISTDDLMLKSNAANLSGWAKIGFDSSIDAVLNIDVLDNLVPASGTLKDVTTAIIGKSGRFVNINITGTLSEPKYRLKPVVENIVRGLSDVLKNAFSSR